MTRRRGLAARLWRLLAAGCCGAALGLVGFTAVYAELPSYLGGDSEACLNCHVMRPQYDAWARGGHAQSATCADCHLPHDNALHKLAVKAEDGLLHGAKFTLGDYPEHIRIRAASLAVVDQACLSCHAQVADTMLIVRPEGGTVSCAHCHADVGHQD
ncbi:MAG: cytochrome c nitrite reductase small subunit [Propionibacteriaceae bacterium]|nr:cytochrome c nitrite reductase small subunit [Propionibacteriaceae bacterium]